MENKRAIIISAICLCISILLIMAYVTVREKELTAEFGAEVDAVVATVDIAEYGLIRKEMLTTKKVFKKFRAPDAISVSNVDDVVGKATYVPIAKGEQITLTKLIHQDGRPVLDRQVEKKMRAVTIMISPFTGVGRLIRPGNRVDVIAAPVYDSGGTTLIEVKTLVQNTLVLAAGKHIQNEVPTRVDRDLLGMIEEANSKLRRKDLLGGGTETLPTSRPDDNYAHVTLQLSQEDAEKIVFLTHSFGDRVLYLILRNSTDQSVAKLETTLLDNVLGPDSDYGGTQRKPPSIVTPPPRFYDNKGGQPIPVY